ncbi:hypothetical protein VNO77_18130 [Canavalia gladiata]|uniref:Uncharacterized protein n=1 Tax=Canavalia gladiata TaxID=3824 RepID=A0AAN9QJB7_CANGL
MSGCRNWELIELVPRFRQKFNGRLEKVPGSPGYRINVAFTWVVSGIWLGSTVQSWTILENSVINFVVNHNPTFSTQDLRNSTILFNKETATQTKPARALLKRGHGHIPFLSFTKHMMLASGFSIIIQGPELQGLRFDTGFV